MQKAKKFSQLSILAAGTFANVIMTILFLLILWGFFVSSFAPAGINFNTYPQEIVSISSIIMINNVSLTNPNINQIVPLLEDSTFNDIRTAEENYAGVVGFLDNDELIVLYEDATAINAGLSSPILEVNDQKITSFEQLREEISKHDPGDTISIKSIEDDEVVYYDIELAERNGEPYLGIGIREPSRKGILGSLFGIITKVKNPFIYYEPIWNGNFAWFIYNLLWWLVLINLSVALVNMLPVGIFDGGRFFYLTVWGITGSEKFGRRAFAFSTWVIILFLVWLMFKWAVAFI